MVQSMYDLLVYVKAAPYSHQQAHLLVRCCGLGACQLANIFSGRQSAATKVILDALFCSPRTYQI